MTPAQQRQLQEVVQKVYDQEKELAALDLKIKGQDQAMSDQDLVIEAQGKIIRDLIKNGGGQNGPTQAQLDKQQLDVEAAQLNRQTFSQGDCGSYLYLPSPRTGWCSSQVGIAVIDF